MQEPIPQTVRVAEKAPGRVERVVAKVKKLPDKIKKVIAYAKEKLNKPREALEVIEKGETKEEDKSLPVEAPQVIDEKKHLTAESTDAEAVDLISIESKPAENLVERLIVIPPNLEVISGPNAGQAGEVHIDRVNKRAYRRADLTRHPDEAEMTKKDFSNKIYVATRDTTGLTPRIYAYDSESLTMEMELIEGQSFSNNITVSVDEARSFMTKLDEFHKLGLYHGDMSDRGHFFKTPTGKIRLIDPIYMPVEVPDSGVTVEKMQAMDRGLALQRFQEFGISEANINGRFFEVKEQAHGELKTKVDDTLEEGIKNGNIQFVYQRGIGFSDGNNPKTRFIETSDFGSEKPMFGSCVVLVARSPETKKTVVLHADKQTDLQAARAQMSQFFGKERVSLAVIGGQSDNSEAILNDINETFTQEPGWKLNQLDILGEKFRQVRQVVVDTETGAIYDLQGEDRRNMKPWSYDQPADIKVRAGKAATTLRGMHIDIPQ